MQWTDQLDREWEELFEDWDAIAPSIERTCQHEDRLQRIERVLDLQDEGETNNA